MRRIQTCKKKVNNLNAQKIFFFKDRKAPTSSITLKHLNRIHRDMDHADYTQIATECIRLGHKVSKSVELRISRVIQECQICKDEDRTFSHGHGKKYKQPSTLSYFPSNVWIQAAAREFHRYPKNIYLPLLELENLFH